MSLDFCLIQRDVEKSAFVRRCAGAFPPLLAPNTALVASAEPQSRTTGPWGLEVAAGSPASADRNTKAMASA